MSLDYLLFLRDEPDLRTYAGQFGLEHDRDDYVLGGMRVWQKPYRPSDDDVLGGHPWRDEVCWVVAAGGRHGDDDYDDFQDLMRALGERYRGGLWCDHGDDIEWFWWDRDALAAQAQPHRLVDLLRWTASANGLVQRGGVREQLVEIGLASLDAIKPLSKRQQLVLELWQGNDDYEEPLRARVGDALLAIEATRNRDLREAQRELEQERAVAADREAPLPSTRGELVALYDRAMTDESARRILLRGIGEYGGDDFMRREIGPLMLERARAGAARPPWQSDFGPWPPLEDAPERATAAARVAFAQHGPFAQAIVKHWDDADEYAAKCDDLIEQRRRGGEMLAGIPDDIRALAIAGQHEQAIAEYARRYGLPLRKAKQVVDANL